MSSRVRYDRAPWCSVKHGEARCGKRADGVLTVGSMAVNSCAADAATIDGRFAPHPRWIASNEISKGAAR